MFRDLKEYQELQKLYEEKVSKTENLQEFKSKFSKPAPPVKSPMEAGMGPGAAKARAMAKARIAAKNADNKKIDTKVDTLANKVDSKPEGANIDTSNEIESSSAEFKANEGDKFNQNFKKQNSKPASQKNRDRLTQSRQNQNKDRLKNQLGGVKKAVGSVASGFKGFLDKLKAKPIERKEGQTSVRQRSNVKTNPNTQNNTDTEKITPKPNTGTDTENKSGKITPKPNTGTDTETKKERRNNVNSSYQYDAYDIVLEYLLTSQQAATIEEANYIMTEMDTKTIQDIISQQLNEQN